MHNQLRGTVRTYQNNRNKNKYIEVKKGNDGHSYFRQYIQYTSTSGEVKRNYLACRSKKGRYHRATLSTISQALSDYSPV